eukprot:IDg16414t1
MDTKAWIDEVRLEAILRYLHIRSKVRAAFKNEISGLATLLKLVLKLCASDFGQ